MMINADYPVVIHEYNESAVTITKNVGEQKNIGINYHFVRELVEATMLILSTSTPNFKLPTP